MSSKECESVDGVLALNSLCVSSVQVLFVVIRCFVVLLEGFVQFGELGESDSFLNRSQNGPRMSSQLEYRTLSWLHNALLYA
jgi:hypothetical protein